MYDNLVTPELLARQILDFRQMQSFAEDPFVIVEGEGLTVTDHHRQAVSGRAFRRLRQLRRATATAR